MNERDLFMAAVQIEGAAERSAYLDQACAGQPALRQRVGALLVAFDQAGSFLQQPAGDPRATSDVPAPGPSGGGDQPEGSGTVIGPYKLVEQIGEGGMGTVWMAQQIEPVKRLVAVKLIKAGMDSKQVIARFEAERQALALMDHPSIAKVLDGGTTSAGRPYFVMDLVKGVPITRYCDEHHLTPKQRLELFIPVCQAVQHAHQKGIIHRDLKPSNVLVALYDGRPVPKVIDFGVAKAAGQSLTDKTLVTGFGNIVGTLEYMSPEQAEINQLDIDTRSDIYSLGVLLYELLTGSPPFTKKDLEKAGMLEMLRVIREQEPSKPSTKLSTAEGLPTLAANRGTEPAKLTKLVRGELDWIVMKALEKDRNRRYETANGFAMDVQRYLADEAVLACPPSVGYRLRKFVRRNKAALLTAALMLIAITTVAGTIGWFINDRQAQQRMTEREVENAVVEANRLQRQAKWADALSWVTRAEGLLAHGRGNEDLRQRVQLLRADLEMVAALEEIRIRTEDVLQPERKDAAFENAFREYGIDVFALDGAEAAKRIQARGIQDHLTDALYDWLICARQKPRIDHLWTVLGLADPDEWRNAFRSAVWRGDFEAQRQLAAQPEFMRLRPYTAAFLGRQFHNRGETPKALELFLAIQQRYPDDFWINDTLAWCYETMRPPRLDQAIRYRTAAVALRPRSPVERYNLGVFLSVSGSYDEAIAAYREAIRLKKDYTAAHDNLGFALLNKGRLDEAIAEFHESIRLNKDSALPHLNLGIALRDKGRLDEAIAEYREAIRINKDDWGAHNNLGSALEAKGRLDEAIAEYREAIRTNKDDPLPHLNLGAALGHKGRTDEAIAELREAIRLNKDFAPPHSILGVTLARKGQLDEAIAEFREAIRIKKDYPEAHSNLGLALGDKGKLDEAIAECREALRLKPDFAAAHNNLGYALQAKGQLEEAIAEYRQAIRLNKALPEAHNNLGVALAKQGKHDEAIAALRRALELDPKRPACRATLAQELNNWAWTLATSPDPNSRDPKRAVELAKEAVQIAPQERNFWNTLGAAQYRAGDWKAARSALEKSMELHQGGDAFDWFFLAMTHWKLANKDEARNWYDKGVEWMEKNARADEELRRFRSEGEELLEIKKK
jgi:tetratricopeptide (TPR) repeat protein/serine/threonine protein kinase